MQKTGFENGFEIFERTHQLLVEYSNTGYEKRNDRKLIINPYPWILEKKSENRELS